VDYEQLRKAAVEMDERKDCAVKAVAVVAGLPYAEAHQHMEAAGRKRRDGTQDYITRRVLKSLGLKTEQVDVKARTVRTLERELKYRSGNFLVWTSSGRHVMAIKNGKSYDWTQGRLHRILRVERVVRDTTLAIACTGQQCSQ
jgi:hypothetical protein